MAPIPGTKGQSIITPPVNNAASITYCCRPLKALRHSVSNKTRRVYVCVCLGQEGSVAFIFMIAQARLIMGRHNTYKSLCRTPATHLSRTLSVKVHGLLRVLQ